MNVNYEIRVLSKNWLEIDEIEKELLRNRKLRENESLYLKEKVNVKRLELIEKKFVNAIIKAEETCNKYFGNYFTRNQNFSLDMTEIRLSALFTSLHENWEDVYQPTIFEQELVSSNFKMFIYENNKEHKNIFDTMFNPCWFSNFDLLSITHIEIRFKLQLEYQNIKHGTPNTFSQKL